MRPIASLFVTAALAACAGDARDRAAPPAKQPVGRAPLEADPKPPEPMPAAPRSDASTADKPLPPLSTPNARPTPHARPGASDAAAAPEQGTTPERHPLVVAGEAAQTCYTDAGLPRGTAGKLQLRITLDKAGMPERIDVDRATSSAQLLGGKLEHCVVSAFKKQRFPAPRSDADVVLNVPLEFKPTQ